jgi:hypothetical protein
MTGKPNAALLQSMSGVSAVNPLVAFYDIHGRKGEVLFFLSATDTTQHFFAYYLNYLNPFLILHPFQIDLRPKLITNLQPLIEVNQMSCQFTYRSFICVRMSYDTTRDVDTLLAHSNTNLD